MDEYRILSFLDRKDGERAMTEHGIAGWRFRAMTDNDGLALVVMEREITT
jgi:hypothetical protein